MSGKKQMRVKGCFIAIFLVLNKISLKVNYWTGGNRPDFRNGEFELIAGGHLSI